MQRITILLKPLTADTPSVSSNLVSFNGYLAYSDSIGGGVVNELNVKDFLESPDNEEITTSFYTFLQSNTVSSEFNAIFYNPRKLADTFNDFYIKIIGTGEVPDRQDIAFELSGSSAHTVTSVDFISDGIRSNRITQVLTFVNTGSSYYMPVHLDLNMGRVESDDFSKFHQDSFGDKQTKQDTLYKRFVTKQTVQLPNPANAPPIEYQGFNNPVAGRGNGTSGLTFFKFQSDKHIVIPTDTNNVIPIKIVFDQYLTASAQTVYMQILTATTAVFGVDFDLNNPSLPNQTYDSIPLSIGTSGVTTNIRIFNSFKNNISKNIVLGLSTVLVGTPRPGANPLQTTIQDVRTFTIINRQPTIPQEVFIETNEVVISTVAKNQKLLQGFVDFNFDDSESEFWRNNVTIVR